MTEGLIELTTKQHATDAHNGNPATGDVHVVFSKGIHNMTPPTSRSKAGDLAIITDGGLIEPPEMNESTLGDACEPWVWCVATAIGSELDVVLLDNPDGGRYIFGRLGLYQDVGSEDAFLGPRERLVCVYQQVPNGNEYTS
jgi:hypothetical protein